MLRGSEEMITIEEAKAISDKICGYPVSRIHDLDEYWLVCFYSRKMPVPGVYPIPVHKETGETGYFFYPDWKGVKPSKENCIWEYEGDLEELLAKHRSEKAKKGD